MLSREVLGKVDDGSLLDMDLIASVAGAGAAWGGDGFARSCSTFRLRDDKIVVNVMGITFGLTVINREYEYEMLKNWISSYFILLKK